MHHTFAHTDSPAQQPLSLDLLRSDPKTALSGLCSLPHGMFTLTDEPIFAAIVTQPQWIQQILTSPPTVFHKGPNIFRFRYAIGDGTATSNLPADNSQYYAPLASLEAFRNHKRRAIMPAFLPNKRGFYTHLIYELTQSYLAERQTLEVRDLYEDMSGLMLCIATNCLFGHNVDAPLIEAAQFTRASYQAVDQQIRLPSQTSTDIYDRGEQAADATWRWQTTEQDSLLRRRRHLVHAAVEFLLNSPLLDPQRRDDLLSLLRGARYKETSEPMSNDQLVTSIIGLIFASYENSAAVAAWTLWSLANDPERMARAQQEVALVLNQTDIQGSDIDRLVYVQACVNESLRLYPPVWSMAREAKQATQLGTNTIPADSVLFCCPWVQHRHAAVWDEADQYRPERFLAGFTPHPGNFFPFGLGARSCIGKSFGLWELTLVVATILRDWQIKPAPAYPPPQPMLRATQRPEPGVFLQLTNANEKTVKKQ